MITSYDAQFKALAALFRDNSPMGATKIAWPNVRFNPPVPPAEYCAFYVLNGEENQKTIGVPGANVHRNTGVVMVNAFVPAGIGESAALQRADTIAAIFRNKVVDSIQLWTPTILSLGVTPDGTYFQVNISTPFYRDNLL